MNQLTLFGKGKVSVESHRPPSRWGKVPPTSLVESSMDKPKDQQPDPFKGGVVSGGLVSTLERSCLQSLWRDGASYE